MKKAILLVVLCTMIGYLISIENESRMPLVPPFTETFTSNTFPPTGWGRFSGILNNNTVLTPSSDVDLGWWQDSFGNAGAPINKSARVNIYSTAIKYWIISPTITLTPLQSFQLEFDMAYTSNGSTQPANLSGIDDRFVVVVSPDNGETWSIANKITEWNNSGSPFVLNSLTPTGNHFIYTLAQYSGDIKIGFYCESTVFNTDNDIFIDNIQVRELQPNQGFTVNPTEKDFGVVGLDTSVSQTFVLSYTGETSISLNSLFIEGSNIFSITGSPAIPAVVLPNDTIEVTVTCMPDSEGVKNGILHLVDSMNTDYNILLSAEGKNYDWGGGDESTTAGGYWFINSRAMDQENCPSFSWIDPIAEEHTLMTEWDQGPSGDTAFFTIPDLGFSFPFYGNSYQISNVFICSNGYISFGSGHTLDAGDATIPGIDQPNNIIALFMQDMDTDNNSHVYYKGYDNKFVITYNQFIDYDTHEVITAQVILYPTGKIKLQYHLVESTWPIGDNYLYDMVIGIENLTGTKGISYRQDGVGGLFYNTNQNDGFAIAFAPDPELLEIKDETSPNIPSVNIAKICNPYPNPFNPETTVSFELKKASEISFKIYNIKGQSVKTIKEGFVLPGKHNFLWNGKTDLGQPCSSGVYFVVLKTNHSRLSKKILLVK